MVCRNKCFIAGVTRVAPPARPRAQPVAIERVRCGKQQGQGGDELAQRHRKRRADKAKTSDEAKAEHDLKQSPCRANGHGQPGAALRVEERRQVQCHRHAGQPEQPDPHEKLRVLYGRRGLATRRQERADEGGEW